jgi:hypothetical protein
MIAKMKARGFSCSFCGRSKGEVANIITVRVRSSVTSASSTIVKSSLARKSPETPRPSLSNSRSPEACKEIPYTYG